MENKKDYRHMPLIKIVFVFAEEGLVQKRHDFAHSILQIEGRSTTAGKKKFKRANFNHDNLN